MDAIIWLIVSLAVGGFLGQHFRGNAKVGTLLGLLGPLGWVLVLVIPDKRVKCPACQSALNPGATKCARCGTEIPEALRVPLPSANQPVIEDRQSWKKVVALLFIIAVAMVGMFALVAWMD